MRAPVGPLTGPALEEAAVGEKPAARETKSDPDLANGSVEERESASRIPGRRNTPKHRQKAGRQ